MSEFDVFLCHNSQDKPEVRNIAQQLQQLGLNPWLDEWHLQPGLPWQRELERQIRNIKSAAVFVGKSGLGPWQEMEIEAYLRRFVKQGSPVIPVLLPNAPEQPELPIFLEGMTWVDFRAPEPMNRLIWGITGKKPSIPNSVSSLQPKSPSRKIELKSAKGVDYTKLRDLLAAGKWKEADQETSDRMLEVINKKDWWDVKVKDIENFPCEDLKTIDQLWVHYSNRRFGFSVQKEIYIGLGGTKEYNDEIWKKFGDQVGWRKGGEWLKYSDLTFELGNTTPVVGHLPLGSNGLGAVGRGWGVRGLRYFFSRVQTCKI